jgi:proteasome lid subunit RPN8/RPN11
MASEELPATIQVRRGVLQAIVEHAREASPDECCGLLIGRHGRVLEVWRTPNVSEDPRRRYLVSPPDHFRALRHARERGLSIMGAYHSHPAGPATPSPDDRADAAGEGFLYLIAAPEEREPRAWRFVAGNFHEVRLVPLS